MYEYRKLSPEQQAEIVRQRRERGFPPHEPPHPIRDQRFYLLTASCYEHASHMLVPARRQQVLNAVFELFTAAGMEIVAWVILPNHYHLLVHVVDFDALRDLFRAIHGPTSHQWNIEDSTPGRKVWFRYSDRAIRSDRHYYTTLNYIHANPVKHGWTKSPYDWIENSVHWYLEHFGREWLQDLWASYPVRDYGHGWDDR
ncbi:MAG: transposase [Anaerolineae bacterium]|nr:transposase [Anaerolineae bacterium]